MKIVVAIRTHVWTDQEDRIMAQLAPVFGDDLCVVFHNRPKGLSVPLPVVDLTDRFLRRHGLRYLDDYGWRCGDYFLYALRLARPDADFYWLIEPDVYFTGDVSDFFTRANASDADLLGVSTEVLKPNHRFAMSLKGVTPIRCIFALTRISGRAIDRVFELRKDYGKAKVRPRNYSNDEVFVWSHMMADPTMTTAELLYMLPDWMGAHAFRADPDILVDTIAGITSPGVYHPVQSRAHFVRAVGRRVSDSMIFLERMRASLANLTDAEMDTLIANVATTVETSLRSVRAQAIEQDSEKTGAVAVAVMPDDELEGKDDVEHTEPARKAG